MEWIFGLLILLLVVLAVTAIGHLQWIAIARIFGYRVKTWNKRFTVSDRYCARCGGRSITANGTCGLCGWSRPEQVATSAADPLAITAEQMTALAQAGLIDSDTREQVMAAISAERKRLQVAAHVPPPLPSSSVAMPPPIPVLPLRESPAPFIAKEATTSPAEVKRPITIEEVKAAELRPASESEGIIPHLPGTPHAASPPLRPPPPVRPPRRPLSEVFASFMEENNIRWGELIGGLLIVGCSVALVVSFWAGITRLPWLQFSVFTAVTAAFFGLGLYTEHRWKLPLTSRGVLLIATLLIPLNFLAFAALSSGSLPGPLTLASEIVAFALFTYLVWQAARVIASIWPEILTAGTCALSACLLVLGCLDIRHADLSRLSLLSILPLAVYVLATAWMLARARRWHAIHHHGVNAIFLLFGVLTFGTTLAIGLLIYRSADAAATLRRLALPMSFGGLPALATGMLLWRRIKGAQLATLRTLGTTLAIVGALILLAGIVVAWPDPLGMLPIALCDFAALTLIALLYEVPAAHLLALPCAVIAWLIGFHLHRHHISRNTSGFEMTAFLLSPDSGTALAPLVILIGAAWAALKQWRIADARIFGRVGMLVAALSLLLLRGFAFIRPPDHYFAAWIYGIYAIAAFALAWRTGRRAFAWSAWLLLAASLIQAFVGHKPTITPWPSALLTAASLSALAAAAIARSDRENLHRIAAPGRWLAAIAPLVAVAIVAVGFSPAAAGRDSINIYWAGGIVLFIAIVEEASLFFIIAQAVLAGGILLSVISRLGRESWFATATEPLLHPWTIQSLAIALALLCLLWRTVRRLFRKAAIRVFARPVTDNAAGQFHVGRALPALPAIEPPGGQCAPYTERDGLDGPVEHVGWAYSPTETSGGRLRPPYAEPGGQCPPYAEGADVVGSAPRTITSGADESIRDADPAPITARESTSSQAPANDRVVTPRKPLVDRLAYLLTKAAVFDREVSAGLLLIALGMALFSIIPALGMEFSSAGSFHFTLAQLQAAGQGSWILIAILALLFLVTVWDTASPVVLIALLTAVWIACPLLAVRMAHSGASASALRWLCAGYFLVCSVPLWLRHSLPRSVVPNRFSQGAKAFMLPIVTRATLLALGIIPVILLTVWPILLWYSGDAIVVPASGTFFGTIGLSISYAVPLIVIALAFVVDAIVKRSETRAFTASVFFCLPYTLVYLLRIASIHHLPDAGDLLRLLQIIAMVIAFFAMSWLLLREGVRRVGRIPGAFPGILKLQVGIALLLNGIILLPAGICLAVAPDWAATFVGLAGGPWALAALLSAVAAGIFSGALRRDRLTVRDLTIATLLLAAMVGLTSVNLWPGMGWRAFHAMLSADVVAAWALLGFGWWIVRRGRMTRAPAPSPPPATSAVESYSGERAGVRGEASVTAESGGTDSGLIAREDPATFTVPPLTPTLFPGYRGEGAKPQADPSAKPASPVLNYQHPDAATAPVPVYFGGQDARTATIGAATAVSMLVIAMDVRALAGDPAAPWWSMGAAGAISLLFVTIACWARRPRALYPAGLLLNFAAATFYLYRGWSANWSAIDFLSIQAIAASIPGVAWLVLELHVFRRGPAISRRVAPAFHHLAAIGATILAVWAASCARTSAGSDPLLAALALLCTAALLFACLWDYKARYVTAGLYALGLGAISLTLAVSRVSPHLLPWALVLHRACYALLTSFIFAHTDDVLDLADRVGVPIQNMYTGVWLPPANAALAVITLSAAAVADFSLEPRSARLVIATAALAQTFTIELLAKRGRWPFIRSAALWTLIVGAILWGWAWLPVNEGLSLDRCAITFITTALLTFILGLLVPRRLNPENAWLPPARQTAALLLIPTILALAGTLVVETSTRIDHPAMRWHGVAIAVMVTILGACMLALESAIRPGDPPRFSDRQRKGFVYAAEALLAIAFFHLRLSEPQLFGGLLRPYWPLVVMTIAFAGVGVAEVFRRQGRQILSEPLERTGIFMPLLPVIGWWLAPVAAVGFGQVLLVVAAFYAVVGALRRSLAFAGVAALAANGALWDALAHSDHLGFLQHPQLWLIPASLCLLAGAQLNRDRLSPDRLRTIRYLCLVLIYVSSTADVFLNGVNHAPWLPLVLVVLSVTGVFVGVLFRIRPFLFLGTAFLFLSILTMIWFASSMFGWTWIWYVAGILLGTGILAIFALFEKKKEQMLALLEGLKRWE